MKSIAFAAATALLLISACGQQSSFTEMDESSPIMAPAPPPEAMREQDAMMEAAPMDPSGGAPVQQQYIAYTHAIGLQLPVAQVEPVMAGHVKACKDAGPSVCLVTNSWANAYSEDSVSASLSLRATPDWIDRFLNGIEAEAEAAKGEVSNRQTTAEDLTVSIIDTGARLNAQQTLQRRLEELLANRPGELGDLLETERELARVNGDIDSLKSTLAALRQRVDMSILSVSYETKRNPVSRGALSPIGDAFGGFFYNLSSALAAVITAFAIGLPWLLLIGALLAVWLRLIWPRIRRKKA